MLHENLNAVHQQSNLDESQEDLEKSTEWIFQGYLFFGSDGWRTDEAYELRRRHNAQEGIT